MVFAMSVGKKIADKTARTEAKKGVLR